MDESQSIRSSFRARRRNNERGFALLVALVLAVLFFGFIELLMIDVTRELGEARRFRGRIVALTLAENAAEMAAKDILSNKAADDKDEDWQGTFTWTMKKDDEGRFEILGTSHSKGAEGTSSMVWLQGEVKAPEDVRILFSRHTQ
jgi:Tfp pilus assembly protein PilX